jgi:hypothetical protein
MDFVYFVSPVGAVAVDMCVFAFVYRWEWVDSTSLGGPMLQPDEQKMNFPAFPSKSPFARA